MKAKVYIVGAGPGDPTLITRKAWEVLQNAEVIVYDRLVGEAIVSLFPHGAECIDVGKEPENHPFPQEAIQELLKKKAQEGKRVVRLKGGDPFIFGRGGEEVLSLIREGIEVEVVPGLSSALAVPALAGIPLTHRGVSTSFMVVSGHDPENLEWEAMARFSGTIVVLMGAKNLRTLTEGFQKWGKPTSLPASLIMEGATTRQRVLVGTLGDIAEKAERAGFRNPLVLVVGEVVSLREYLSFWEKRPLFGKRILVTGTTMDSFAFPSLSTLGAEVFRYPTVRIEFDHQSLEELYQKVPSCHLLFFSSKNAVMAFRSFMQSYRFDMRNLVGISLAAVGRKTAQELESMSLYPDYLPSSFTASALSEVLPEGRGKLALILTSQIGGEEGSKVLAEKGYRTEKIALYRSLPNWEVKDRIRVVLRSGVDAVVFSSPSSFQYLEEMLEESRALLNGVYLVAIGPTTARFIHRRGFHVVDLPEEYTLEGVEKALLARWR
ncbi:MAG: uroporphyrinogen-III C-methyltransferase [Atribacterota bacterium]